jgi:hypothetical protein
MNIFLSMSESRSQSFKFKQPKVENIDGKSILTFETRDNGCITIISDRMMINSDKTIHDSHQIFLGYPYYFVKSDGEPMFIYRREQEKFEVHFTKDGVMKSILCSFNGNSVAINNLKRLELINDLTFDLSKRTLKDMLADVVKETDEIKRVEKLEEILKQNCKPEPPKQPEPPKSGWPSTLKWVLIVLGVLFMIGGFWVLNKESYEIVNAKQV